MIKEEQLTFPVKVHYEECSGPNCSNTFIASVQFLVSDVGPLAGGTWLSRRSPEGWVHRICTEGIMQHFCGIRCEYEFVANALVLSERGNG